MPSCRTYLLVKLIILWGYVNDVYHILYNKLLNTYMYFKHFYEGHHDTWLFIPGHTFPLVKSNLYNNIDIIWMYDNSSNKLTLNIDPSEETQAYRFSWLSSTIKITQSTTSETDSHTVFEYNIDDFIEKFSIETTEDLAPNLYTIFLCWCAHTKHWFKINDIIEFNVIDENGDDKTFNIFNHNNSLVFTRNKIYINTLDNSSTEDVTVEQAIQNTEIDSIIEETSKDD